MDPCQIGGLSQTWKDKSVCTGRLEEQAFWAKSLIFSNELVFSHCAFRGFHIYYLFIFTQNTEV